MHGDNARMEKIGRRSLLGVFELLPVVVLFPVFPCPPVVVLVVVVEEFVLLPTFSVVVTRHVTTPSTRANVPPEASHSASEGETA